jgi:hypothetical protein
LYKQTKVTKSKTRHLRIAGFAFAKGGIMSNTDKPRTWAEVRFGKAKRAFVRHEALGDKRAFGASTQKGATSGDTNTSKQLGGWQHDSSSSAQVAHVVAPHASRLKPEERLHHKNERPTDSKPAARKRLHPYGVRFSAEELTKVRERAKEIGFSVNSYIRASVLDTDYTPPRDPVLVEVLRRTLVELSRQGNNLNQIARHLNAGITTPAQGEGAMEAVYPTYLRTLSKVRSALAQGKPEP